MVGEKKKKTAKTKQNKNKNMYFMFLQPNSHRGLIWFHILVLFSISTEKAQGCVVASSLLI